MWILICLHDTAFGDVVSGRSRKAVLMQCNINFKIPVMWNKNCDNQQVPEIEKSAFCINDIESFKNKDELVWHFPTEHEGTKKSKRFNECLLFSLPSFGHDQIRVMKWISLAQLTNTSTQLGWLKKLLPWQPCFCSYSSFNIPPYRLFDHTTNDGRQCNKNI